MKWARQGRIFDLDRKWDDPLSKAPRNRARRRLAAILVASYGQLFPGEEGDRFAGLTSFLTELIEPLIPEFGGNIFKHTAELARIEFESVVEAVRCAAAMREATADMNRLLPNERRIAMRIGINLGDVIIEDGDFFGDGVNIAARLGALAEPGSVYVSGIVHDQVADRVDFDFEDLGPKQLKNIRRPIHVYRMGGESAGELEAGAAPTLAPAAGASFDDRRAIAVLPFNNFSNDPEQEFFADGITEDIISLLSGWRAFPVIARNSTFTYKGQTVDVKKAGEELGAFYVLEGSVRKSGHRVRVTVQLIQADTAHHIMAERYDRDLIDLFELQDEVTRAIAGAIQPELLKFERERIAERPQHNEDAYALYQRGMFHHYRQNKADNVEAQSCFRRALEIDNEYSQAVAALSIAVCNAAYLGWAEDAEHNYREAAELAQRAIALDARYPNAYFALGLVCMWTKRPERAMSAFNEAINLNPSFAAAYVLLGQMHLYGGDPEEALSLAEKGIRLSPTDPRLYIWLTAVAGANYQLRHYDAAIESGRRSWTLNPNWPGGLRYVAAGLAELGRVGEAEPVLAELRKLNPNLAFVEGNLKRLFTDEAAVEHIVAGLRKAGFD